jgi:hypothetical protein
VPGGQCVAGDCALPASCAAILVAAPGSLDGEYEIEPVGGGGPRRVYCAMSAGGRTYESLGIGSYTINYPGYTLASIAMLTDPVVQQAFISLYNLQGGMLINILPGWSEMNCCVAVAPATHLMLNGQVVFPADLNNNIVCNVTYNDVGYRFNTTSGVSPPTLPTDFFVTHPPTAMVYCSDANNPGFFLKTY